MMEPICVNHVTITRELFEESFEAIFSVKRKKMLLYAGIVFLCTGLILLAFESRIPGASALYIPLILTGGIVIIWSLTLKKSDLRKKYRAFQQKNGDAAVRTITGDRTGLEIDTGNGKPIRIQYTEVQDHKETPHLYLLLCSGHTGVQLARDGFEKGCWEDLLKAIDRAKQEAEIMADLM